jgi:hypothetical protein
MRLQRSVVQCQIKEETCTLTSLVDMTSKRDTARRPKEEEMSDAGPCYLSRRR